jgi:hypothetical protein
MILMKFYGPFPLFSIDSTDGIFICASVFYMSVEIINSKARNMTFYQYYITIFTVPNTFAFYMLSDFFHPIFVGSCLVSSLACTTLLVTKRLCGR